MKLLSLFDGSGGFLLAGEMCGIEPVYASEIEPYPIAVSKSHFPNVKHLGDICKIKGSELEPVDIITFGSPCQNMSIAGNREGIKHITIGSNETTQSGLFIEAIRVIKEMRLATNGVYPRYAVWENVCGAFNSNKGEDFRTVLEEFIRISEPNAVMPKVPKAGWAYADCISGNGWSIAYRTFDAQYWGVPQRRRRIYLVADFRGGRAKEILFKREGLRWHTAQSGTQGQGITRDIENSLKADDRKRIITVYDARGNGDGQTVPTITGDHNNRVTDYTALCCEGKPIVLDYIVRRLTPTECARLQGFPSKWGFLDVKEDFTEEEYKFWLKVRNTYARINNKAVKDYTKAQILIWYNKLHTDSAEYKMWGNGIALPNALYVMQGISWRKYGKDYRNYRS